MGEEDGVLENRPGILIVGSSNVGKRTLLSRNVPYRFLFILFIDNGSGVLCMLDSRSKLVAFSLFYCFCSILFDCSSIPFLLILKQSILLNDSKNPLYNERSVQFCAYQVPDFDDFKSFLSIVGLLSVDFEDVSESSSEVLVHGCDSGLLKLLLCAIFFFFFILGFSKNTYYVALTAFFFLMNSWTIDTKYYTAEVFVRMANLHDEFSIGTLPMFNRLAALVMVFDMSDVGLFPFDILASCFLIANASISYGFDAIHVSYLPLHAVVIAGCT
jgi:hypothetical protein